MSVDGRRGEGIKGKGRGELAGSCRGPGRAEVVEAVDVALQAVPIGVSGPGVGRQPVGGHVHHGLDDVAPPGGRQVVGYRSLERWIEQDQERDLRVHGGDDGVCGDALTVADDDAGDAPVAVVDPGDR